MTADQGQLGTLEYVMQTRIAETVLPTNLNKIIF